MTDAMSPLELDIRRRIAAAGPMPVDQYMALCLGHPEHGYYVTRDPFGVAGDFTTAPEVSQMFGELIGLWMATAWQQMGAPDNIRVIELGPGRGTLMKDALRAAKVMPAFLSAAVVHFVDISPVLRVQQEDTMHASPVPVFWHSTLAEVPPGPALIIANEFFDALPINQAVKMADGWHTRCVGIAADGSLEFAIAPAPIPHFERTVPEPLRTATEGEIFEWRFDAAAMNLGRRLSRDRGAALVIDYGHAESSTGDTLQAVGHHAFADPLVSPGNADLTAHVDFQSLARAVESMGAKASPVIDQAVLLRRLGIETRAASLKANATPATVADVNAALARLTGAGRTGMGTLFKAIAFTHPRMSTPPGF
jgi:SAM-dependent MidA family methyltransferase